MQNRKNKFHIVKWCLILSVISSCQILSLNHDKNSLRKISSEETEEIENILTETPDGLNPILPSLKEKKQNNANVIQLNNNSDLLRNQMTQIFEQWDSETDDQGNYSNETNQKYILLLAPIIKLLFENENVQYFHPQGQDPKNQFKFVISRSLKNKNKSALNKFAYSMYQHMDGVKVMYDPLDLYEKNYGGSFNESEMTLRLSNPAMTTNWKNKSWMTLNEFHESIHAKVTDLQNDREFWHPFWAQLKCLPDVKGFMPPYTRSIFFDEIMAYHKQLLYLSKEVFVSRLERKERNSQFDLYFSTLFKLTKSVVDKLNELSFETNKLTTDNIKVLKQEETFNSNTFNKYEIKLQKDQFNNSHIYINKNGYIFNLVLNFNAKLLEDINQFNSPDVLQESLKVAQLQLADIQNIMNKLMADYTEIQKLAYFKVNQSSAVKLKKLDQSDYDKIDQILNKNRNLISFGKGKD